MAARTRTYRSERKNKKKKKKRRLSSRKLNLGSASLPSPPSLRSLRQGKRARPTCIPRHDTMFDLIMSRHKKKKEKNMAWQTRKTIRSGRALCAS